MSEHERIRDLRDGPRPERDPGSRRRLDGDQMRQRDAAVARLLAAHVPYRKIAARLDMSLGSVQQAVARIRAATPARERVVKVPRHRSRWGISSEQW
jgi:DNA-binding CsgD family transcriptional regulator